MERLIKMKVDYEKYGMNVTTKRNKRYLDAGLLDEVDNAFITKVHNYWKKHYQKEIDPSIHVAYKNLTGKEEPRLVPGLEMSKDFIPYFNDRTMISGYRDKNLYDILIDFPHSVETIVKRTRNNYYDSKNNYIEDTLIIDTLESVDNEFIIKSSDTNNGVSVEKLVLINKELTLANEKVSLKDLEDKYGSNFAIQKIIKQHDIMSDPHPNSVNTLRMVTFRWRGEIKYLLTFARFGAGGSIKDNAGAGGICVGVKDSGEFLETAIDEQCNVYTHHPTTNYSFADMSAIPNFDKFKSAVMKAHKNILHHDFISWDIAISENGDPIFIEANFAGAVWLYQLACQRPIFGSLTEDVLQYVHSERENKVRRDIKGSSSKARRRLRARNKKLIKDNKRLIEQVKKKEKRIQVLKGENTK